MTKQQTNEGTLDQQDMRPALPKTNAQSSPTIITLFPEKSLNGHTSRGHYMINIDGHRTLNAYVISDGINSKTSET